MVRSPAVRRPPSPLPSNYLSVALSPAESAATLKALSRARVSEQCRSIAGLPPDPRVSDSTWKLASLRLVKPNSLGSRRCRRSTHACMPSRFLYLLYDDMSVFYVQVFSHFVLCLSNSSSLFSTYIYSLEIYTSISQCSPPRVVHCVLSVVVQPKRSIFWGDALDSARTLS